MAKNIEFSNEGYDHHHCQSWQEGEWLFFQCPHCRFLRKLNWQSNQLVTLNAGDEFALHHGVHRPTQWPDLLLD